MAPLFTPLWLRCIIMKKREKTCAAHGCNHPLRKSNRILVVFYGKKSYPDRERRTSKDDIERFILALDLDHWNVKTLPDHAAKMGSFQLTQEETIKYGQTAADGALCDVAAITLAVSRSLLPDETTGEGAGKKKTL